MLRKIIQSFIQTSRLEYKVKRRPNKFSDSKIDLYQLLVNRQICRYNSNSSGAKADPCGNTIQMSPNSDSDSVKPLPDDLFTIMGALTYKQFID